MFSERSQIRSACNVLLDFCFPRLCLSCAQVTDSEDQICDKCQKGLDRLTNVVCLSCFALLPLNRRCPICKSDYLPLFAHSHYRPHLDEIIIQFKFKGIHSPAKVLMPELLDQFDGPIAQLEFEALVPIPLHPRRRNRRGYNQSELLANEVADRLEIPLIDDLLLRVKYRPPQTSVALGRRETNVRGSFAVGDSISDVRRVILVDDVVTTGATINEAVKVLGESGVEVVGVIALGYGG